MNKPQTIGIERLGTTERRALAAAGRDPDNFIAVCQSATRLDVTVGGTSLYVGGPKVPEDEVELSFSFRVPRTLLPALNDPTVTGVLRNVIAARLLRAQLGARPLVRVILDAAAVGVELPTPAEPARQLTDNGQDIGGDLLLQEAEAVTRKDD